MKTIKIKFVGKWEGIRPEDNTITYYLMKNGYTVMESEDPDYIICDTFGEVPYGYCRYPQVRIFECGENVVPDFNTVDYAVSRYPVFFGDRNFYQPGCAIPADHWYALRNRDLGDLKAFLDSKTCFANLITSHDSENGARGEMLRKLGQYKRVESAGTFANNMPGGETVNWKDQSKVDFQRKCKFTICFESTVDYGFITEKITDAFYAGTIPIYLGSANITDFFNKDAFINCSDYASLDEVVERVKELDQNDERYLKMLGQAPLVDNTLPERLDEELEKYILHIFEQPIEKAYRRGRVYFAKRYNDSLAKAVDPETMTAKAQLRRLVKKIAGRK